MKRYLRIIIALLGLTVRGVAGASEPGMYSFLDIPASAYTYGLGGVNISALDAGVFSTLQNPALLGPEYERKLSLSYMRYISDANFAGAMFANSVDENSAYAFGVRYFGYGSMTRNEIDGTESGSFSPKDIVVNATYSRDIVGLLRGGATLNWIYSSYDSYTAMAIGVDLGVNYYDPDRDLSLSATVVNLGGQVKRFDTRYERIPLDVRLGWTQSFPGLPIRFSITAWNLTKWHLPYVDSGDGSEGTTMIVKQSFASDLFRHLVFAADLIPSERFHIGVGYNYKVRTDMSDYSRNLLSGFSIGAGLNVGGWSVGAAFAQHHRGAATLMINLSASLSRLL